MVSPVNEVELEQAAGRALDVTGAGDTVAAAFSAGLAVSGDPVAAARLANVAGALQVRKPGTATVSRAELAAELGLPPPAARAGRRAGGGP